MDELNMIYEKTPANVRRDYNADEIIDYLLQEPFNLDINVIAQTPAAVFVNLPREEYSKKRIANLITKKFNVATLCKDTMLIIKPVWE